MILSFSAKEESYSEKDVDLLNLLATYDYVIIIMSLLR